MKKIYILIALLAAVILVYLIASSKTPQRYRKSADLMYTTVSVTVVAGDRETAEEAIDAAFKSISALERSLSSWTNTSEIGRINELAGKMPVKVSVRTFEIASLALEIAQNTSGAFDPTVGPLMRLWDYRKAKIPSREEVSRVLKRVGFRKITFDLDGQSVFLSKPDMYFDTGGIAKGYAVDRAVEVLKEHGISSGLVTIAGDMRAFGTREDGEPWKVGIRDPRGESEEDIIATLELRDEAVSTSGDYERFFIKDGKRYHHIIDPATGYPAEGTMSFSVIAPRAVLTDGYSTGAFVLGPQKGIETLEEVGLEGLAISSDGKTYATEELSNRIKWVSDRYRHGM